MEWRLGSYVHQMYKVKGKSFKLNLKLTIVTYFNILNRIEYLEMKYFLLENSNKYRYNYIKNEQNKILMDIESIKKTSYLNFNSDSEDSYTDDSYTDDSNSECTIESFESF